MGTTLESALVITAVIAVLVAFIIVPASFCADTVQDYKDAQEELYEERDLTQEELCTFLTGISENYRLIYGGLRDAVTEEG